MENLNKFIGIPFKLNGKDFFGCDCRGICWLYLYHVKGKEYPFSDGKGVIFRNKKNDIMRMLAIIKPLADPVEFNDLGEGDIVMLKTQRDIGVLGICINKTQLLHMDKKVGSCLTKLYYLKDLFLYGFRLR